MLKPVIHPVVPHVGTWIEMQLWDLLFLRSIVVPHVGTWIEISIALENLSQTTSFPTWERGLKCPETVEIPQGTQSFPTWERGLKSSINNIHSKRYHVVPHVGTWIEICLFSGACG